MDADIMQNEQATGSGTAVGESQKQQMTGGQLAQGIVLLGLAGYGAYKLGKEIVSAWKNRKKSDDGDDE